MLLAEVDWATVLEVLDLEDLCDLPLPQDAFVTLLFKLAQAPGEARRILTMMKAMPTSP
ncbi:unnamed protein product, partial [Amoebophrya sp. A25]|eukprot:GSA25T00027563001.1